MRKWKRLRVAVRHIEYNNGNRARLRMPHNSEYDGYIFWIPSKLIELNPMWTEEGTRTCQILYTDEFKFKLKKLGYDRFDKLITVDEKEITPQELRKAFTNINTEPTDREEPLIHRPSKLEPLANVEPLEELLDD